LPHGTQGAYDRAEGEEGVDASALTEPTEPQAAVGAGSGLRHGPRRETSDGEKAPLDLGEKAPLGLGDVKGHEEQEGGAQDGEGAASSRAAGADTEELAQVRSSLHLAARDVAPQANTVIARTH
jgi:hypothetical protein